MFYFRAVWSSQSDLRVFMWISAAACRGFYDIRRHRQDESWSWIVGRGSLGKHKFWPTAVIFGVTQKFFRISVIFCMRFESIQIIVTNDDARRMLMSFESISHFVQFRLVTVKDSVTRERYKKVRSNKCEFKKTAEIWRIHNTVAQQSSLGQESGTDLIEPFFFFIRNCIRLASIIRVRRPVVFLAWKLRRIYVQNCCQAT